MSLKFRLFLSIGIGFALALLLGGALAILRAKQSVQTEMAAALQGGADIVADTPKARLSDLEHIVRGFDGVRHLQVTLRNPARQIVTVSRPAHSVHEAPWWFASPIAPPVSSLRISGAPMPARWSLEITADPRNEIAEVWGQTRDAFVALIAFCVGTGVLVYLLVGRSLGFLGGLGQALRRVAEGQHDITLAEEGPPEFARLARGYNRMALRLSQYERENKKLLSQIAEIQEDERAEIARDLHDEVGPLLFSINVDAAALPELAVSQDFDGVKERAGRIGDAAGQIQQQVKGMLRQLKPVDVLDFGLDVAIRELFSFWETRFPDLYLSLQNMLNGLNPDRVREEVVYRVVQESLSNAIRHGQPRSVAVLIAAPLPDQLVVTITDDGCGLSVPRPARGAGLTGMAERVFSLGGSMSIENNKPANGVVVKVTLPVERTLNAEKSVA